MFAADRFAWPRALRLLGRKVKRFIEFVAFGLFDTLTLFRYQRQSGTNTVAVVHLELLGDYVLWLPYGWAMAQHFLQHGKRVTLVLNAGMLPLAKRHFPGGELIGIDRAAFLRCASYRAKVLRRLRQLGIEATYHDTYPRDALIEDACVRALGAPAWGFDAVFADRPALDRWWHRCLYTRLLPPMPNVHQSVRHRAFLEALDIAAEAIQPITGFAAGLDAPLDGPYFVVAPGASRGSRAWPVAGFAEVASRVLSVRADWRCVVVGTGAERHLGEVIARTCGGRVVNLAGETDLLGLVGAVAHARLVIGNDSAVGHIAAACGVPAVVVVGGGHYGRCFPYDPAEARVGCLPTVVSVAMECFGCDWICRYQAEGRTPYPCITSVAPQSVWAAVERILSNGAAMESGAKPDASPAAAR